MFMQEIEAMPGDEFLDTDISFMPWRSAKFVFDQMKKLFDSDVYSMPILKGLITSSGGLTESTVKASQSSLFEYLSEMTKQKGEQAGIDTKLDLLKKLTIIFEENFKNDRVTVPLMKTIEMLISADYLSEPEVQPAINDLHAICVKECSKSKNIVKLIAAVGVMSGMLGSCDTELQKKAIKTLLFMLYHNFPKVRVLAAEKLYTGLLTLDEYDAIIPGGEEAYDEANELLSETNWSEPIAKLTDETKIKMYGFFGLEPKMPVKK